MQLLQKFQFTCISSEINRKKCHSPAPDAAMTGQSDSALAHRQRGAALCLLSLECFRLCWHATITGA